MERAVLMMMMARLIIGVTAQLGIPLHLIAGQQSNNGQMIFEMYLAQLALCHGSRSG